jgi:hypothetical protein
MSRSFTYPGKSPPQPWVPIRSAGAPRLTSRSRTALARPHVGSSGTGYTWSHRDQDYCANGKHDEQPADRGVSQLRPTSGGRHRSILCSMISGWLWAPRLASYMPLASASTTSRSASLSTSGPGSEPGTMRRWSSLETGAEGSGAAAR